MQHEPEAGLTGGQSSQAAHGLVVPAPGGDKTAASRSLALRGQRESPEPNELMYVAQTLNKTVRDAQGGEGALPAGRSGKATVGAA